MQKRSVEICNIRGLHARASNAFSRLSQEFDCKVTVVHQDFVADARSIMELLSLAASKGCTVDITTEGPDEEAAIQALVGLIENRFGEED